jgi:hypothetical protein
MGPRNLHLISKENPVRVMRNEALKSMEGQEIPATVTKRRRWRFWENGAKSNPQIPQIKTIVKSKNKYNPQITQINAD